jgi:hypothetical protein
VTVSAKVKFINKPKVQYLSILSRLGAGEATTEHRKPRQLVPSKNIEVHLKNKNKNVIFMLHPQGILYILYQLSLQFESESKLGFL